MNRCGWLIVSLGDACDRFGEELHLPIAAGHRGQIWVRNLPDTGGAGFVALNDRFGGANRSLIGHNLTVTLLKFPALS